MKDRLNALYHELLLGREEEKQPHLLELITAIIENIKNNQILGSIWKASIKTLIKLL